MAAETLYTVERVATVLPAVQMVSLMQACRSAQHILPLAERWPICVSSTQK